MNYWIEKTIVKGRKDREVGERALGRVLWSPQKDKRGADIYKNMRNIEVGDIVLHLIDNSHFAGISKVKNSFIKTQGVSGTDWEGPAYLVDLKDYTELKPLLKRDLLLNHYNATSLEEISEYSEVFYTKNLALRQGAYLTPCPEKLLKLINKTYKSISNSNLPFIDAVTFEKDNQENENYFHLKLLNESIKASRLYYSNLILARFTASLLTKPFVILTGLSGSGKTKLAQAFVEWICKDDNQYRLVPVGADWTNREPLLGYPNALDANSYVKPDTGVLDLLLNAISNPELPYFLILDEMNLSHVERYFADFLSTMESQKEILLHDSKEKDKSGVPAKIPFPENLFIIGTVNIDETTHMFSPKVLDRANTIEFRISTKEMAQFLEDVQKVDLTSLKGQGQNMAFNFLSRSKETKLILDHSSAFIEFFKNLQKVGAEFGYRTATEMSKLLYHLEQFGLNGDQAVDIAIMQKLLPKLHGSRRKLRDVLVTLAEFCVEAEVNVVNDIFENEAFDFSDDNKVKYPLSLEKITRMYRGAIANGFASYAEA